MHTIQPARLKPHAALPSGMDGAAATVVPNASSLIRGRAPSSRDPKSSDRARRSSTRSTPIRSLRPGTACRRASTRSRNAGRGFLPSPDARLPCPRALRQTFLIAGDRFAIGSSREMSPAGLKGVAEEVGLETGGRLRPQHGRHLPPQRFNLGLHVGAEPGGGGRCSRWRRVHLRSGDPLGSPTRPRKDLRPGAPVAQGRGHPPQRRHLRGGPARIPGLRCARPRRSSGPTRKLRVRLTTTEQILWAHRVDKI